MANVFDKIGDIKNDVRRNNFDWSHDNNFTTGLGRIIPVFCAQVPAGSSLRINPTFGLQFMPMMFPVQTKVRAYLSAYRMPIRALWKDYKDWVSSANDADSTLEAPYMSFQPNFGKGEILGVSGLADYIGLPVTAAMQDGSITGSGVGSIYDPDSNDIYVSLGLPNLGSTWSGISGISAAPYNTMTEALSDNVDKPYKAFRVAYWGDGNSTVSLPSGSDGAIRGQYTFSLSQSDGEKVVACIEEIRQINSRTPGVSASPLPVFILSMVESTDVCLEISIFPEDITWYTDDAHHYYFTCAADGAINLTSGSTATSRLLLYFPNVVGFSTGNSNTNASMNSDDKIITFSGAGTVGMNKSTCPYFVQGRNNDNAIKISAYPFRTYEAIYNAYIRNNKNNPFLIDGKPVYNTWIPTDAGGADTTEYELHRSNWASDMFTTAVPSPQQGQAPLVGITTYESTRTLDNGHVETTINTALVDEDGNKYKVDFESNGEELKNVNYIKLSSDTPVKPLSSLYDLVTSGISINDFRNVNAYQRYLELNMFRGYSYKDIVEGRFDVNIKYDDLNMPEYLGGCTRDVIINPVTQTVQTSTSGTYDGSLGSQAGLGQLRGDCQNISCYCDEESIIMVLLSVVPMPVYTQALPKYLTYRERLDSFNPEFDNIGFQPIRMKEIAPIQQWMDDPAKLDDVFGYQRPWYEYCQQLDTAHGLFKTNLRNFLINRVFRDVPQLSAEFTTVDENEVNDVFAVTDVTDKILGQIHFDITAKLPISRVVVPKLE